MISNIKEQLKIFLTNSFKDAYQHFDNLPLIELEVPSDQKHGDFSCNIALKSAKIFKKAPLQIANDFLTVINERLASTDIASNITKIEVKAPGFINFYLSKDSIYSILDDIFSKKDDYGKIGLGQGEKLQIEFVSANPTGPLSVAHARQAAVGDALCNILNFIGFDTTKEYYVNDGGNQINILGQSIKLRIQEILGVTVDFPEDYYQGDYIKDMAKIYIQDHNIKDQSDWDCIDDTHISDFGATYLLNVIKEDLKDFGVNFDVWSHESKIANQKSHCRAFR